jgi:hypothetical protein
VCPNFFLSERALALNDRTLFAAHELAQMVPIGGLRTYSRFRSMNGWSAGFLPNARGAPRLVDPGHRRRPWSARLAEWAGRSAVGTRIERWEMRRKIRRFGNRANPSGEAAFGPDWCKGHFGGYGERVLEAFATRVRSLEDRVWTSF